MTRLRFVPGSIARRRWRSTPVTLRRPALANGAGRVNRAVARGQRFVIVASRVHPSITAALVRGAEGELRRCGAGAKQIRTLWVPGAFELPVAAARVAAGRPKPDAIIAVGVLIRGQTTQYTAIAHAVAQGLAEVSVSFVLPVTLGVIVAETMAQAKARAGGALGNRGVEAAVAAIEMVQTFDALQPVRASHAQAK